MILTLNGPNSMATSMQKQTHWFLNSEEHEVALFIYYPWIHFCSEKLFVWSVHDKVSIITI